jgi:hypothetical protein
MAPSAFVGEYRGAPTKLKLKVEVQGRGGRSFSDHVILEAERPEVTEGIGEAGDREHVHDHGNDVLQ